MFYLVWIELEFAFACDLLFAFDVGINSILFDFGLIWFDFGVDFEFDSILFDVIRFDLIRRWIGQTSFDVDCGLILVWFCLN